MNPFAISLCAFLHLAWLFAKDERRGVKSSKRHPHDQVSEQRINGTRRIKELS